MSFDICIKTNSDVAKTLLRYLVAAYVMGATNDLADARGVLLPDRFEPLPDLGFDYLPFVPDAKHVADVFVTSMYAVVLVRVFISKYKNELFCLFIEMHICLMLLRSATVAMTTLPTPSMTCARRLQEKPGLVFLDPAVHFLKPGGMSSWCHDMLFSGHGMLYVIAALFLHDAGGYIVFPLIGWTLALVGTLCLIMSRMHYTVDVAIAIIIAYFVYLRSRREIVHLVDTER